MACLISTHVLDTERGQPARGVPVTLSRGHGNQIVELATAETNEDGRILDLLGGPLVAGDYQLTFDLAPYFGQQGREAPFFTRFVVEFQIRDTQRHYHIPLLLSPYSVASYRGS